MIVSFGERVRENEFQGMESGTSLPSCTPVHSVLFRRTKAYTGA